MVTQKVEGPHQAINIEIPVWSLESYVTMRRSLIFKGVEFREDLKRDREGTKKNIMASRHRLSSRAQGYLG